MPARHTSLPAGLLSESRFLKIGSCRRKRVSARHQVKRLDRNFEGACSFEERSGRRNRFSSFGADLRGLQFHGLQGSNRAARFSVKSGPDVFADALVQSPVPLAPPGILYPPISQTNCPDQPRCASAGFFRAPTGTVVCSAPLSSANPDFRLGGGMWSRVCRDGYRFAKWQGKPNSSNQQKPL